MSRKQRRDHPPKPMTSVRGLPDRCRSCGDRVSRVYHRSGRHYWRHWRRA